MGGGIAAVKGTQNSMKAHADLVIVHCAIDLISGNNVLFDREILFSDFNEVAAKYFTKYGVKFKIGRIAQLGGGAFILIEIIKQLWAHKEILKIFFEVIRHGYKILINLNDKNKHRVHVNLWIETDADLEYVHNSELKQLIVPELIILKNMSDDLCKILKDKYPLFVFDQIFGVYLVKKNFSTRFFLADEYQNSFNKMRLSHLFNNLKIEDNFATEFRFNKSYLIEYKKFDCKYLDGGGAMKKYKEKQLWVF